MDSSSFSYATGIFKITVHSTHLSSCHSSRTEIRNKLLVIRETTAVSENSIFQSRYF